MRVCQVVPRYPPRTGGVETHVQELSERLVDREHDVTVVTADYDDDVLRRETRNGVTVCRHRGAAPGGAFHIAPGVARSVRRVDADVVHAHNYHSLPLLFAAFARGDARFVVTPHYHGESASDFRDRLLTFYRPFGGWALRRADAVLAVSDWEQDRIAADFGVSATVAPNGIDIVQFSDAIPYSRERPYLLTVGRLEEYKGVQYAVRALSELPEYDLIVAGSGGFSDALHEVAREVGVANRVEFLGYVPDSDLPGLYAGAAVFVTLSGFEAYGMTIGEALAAGTPCVVREAGALVDWTDRTDCVGVDDTAPGPVADAVKSAVGRVAEPESLPTWEDTVDNALEAYTGAQA